MKSPRFLAALAMAAVLTTGVTAHAASATPGFHEVTSGTSGQASMQQANDFKSDTDLSQPDQKLDATGEIRVDGKFTKIVNNFPHPDKDGHYLRVTMPIKMDFSYDLDSDVMVAAQGTVVNNSVEATGVIPGANKGTLTPKQVKMTILDFKENAAGNINSDVEFVNDAKDTTPGKLGLPFQLNITGKGGSAIKNYTIKNIRDNATNSIPQGSANAISPIIISENTSVMLEVNRIPSQDVANKDVVTNQTSLTSHNLKLQFEYIKK